MHLISEQRPVTITCGFWILSIDSINVMDMVRKFRYNIDDFRLGSFQSFSVIFSSILTLVKSKRFLKTRFVPTSTVNILA